MIDITTTIDDYIAAWNEGDETRRRALVARTFADDATYVDPLVSGEGTDGIAGQVRITVSHLHPDGTDRELVYRKTFALPASVFDMCGGGSSGAVPLTKASRI